MTTKIFSDKHSVKELSKFCKYNVHYTNDPFYKYPIYKIHFISQISDKPFFRIL